MNPDRKLSFQARLVRADTVQAALTAARLAQKEFIQGMKDLMPMLYPEQERATLNALVAQETDPAVIAEAVKRLNEIAGDGARAAKDRAIVLSKGLHSRFTVSITALIRAADSAADELIADAVAAEQNLFTAFNRQPEPTSISDAARMLKRQIRSLTDRSASHAHLVSLGQARLRPDEHREVLAWFK